MQLGLEFKGWEISMIWLLWFGEGGVGREPFLYLMRPSAKLNQYKFAFVRQRACLMNTPPRPVLRFVDSSDHQVHKWSEGGGAPGTPGWILPGLCHCWALPLVAPPAPADLLKVDFLAQSKLYFWEFSARKCAQNTQKVTRNVLRHAKKCKNGKNARNSSFVVHISRSCANSTKICAVTPPHNRHI